MDHGPPIPDTPWFAEGLVLEDTASNTPAVAATSTAPKDRTSWKAPRVKRMRGPHDEARLDRFTRKVTQIVNSLLEQKFLQTADASSTVPMPEFALRSGGFVKARAPTVNDDLLTGVSGGAVFVDTSVTPNVVYVMTSGAVGAATWVQVSGLPTITTADLPASVVPPFVDDQPLIEGSADATKLYRVEVDTNVPAGTTVVHTAREASYTPAATNLTNTFTVVPQKVTVSGKTLQISSTQLITTDNASGLQLEQTGASGRTTRLYLDGGTVGSFGAQGMIIEMASLDLCDACFVTSSGTSAGFRLENRAGVDKGILTTPWFGFRVDFLQNDPVFSFGKEGCFCYSVENNNSSKFAFYCNFAGNAFVRMGEFQWDSSNTTHATRTNRLKILVANAAGDVEGIRVDCNSTDALVTIGADATFGGLVVNENGEDADVRIEGDTDPDLLFVDASTDRVGIGTNAPTTLLEVDGIASVKTGAATSVSTVGGCIFNNTMDSNSISTDGTEDDLASDTLAASTFGTDNDKVVAEYTVITVAHATATRRVQVYLAGTVIADSGTLTTTAAGTISVSVIAIREASDTLKVRTILNASGVTLQPIVTYTRITPVTLTDSQILKITGIAAGAGAAASDISYVFSFVNWFPAAV